MRLAAFLQHLHLGFLGLVVLCAPGGQEIDEEASDVEAIGICNDPFQDSSNVPLVLLGADAECNDETKFEDDEE